MSFLAELAERTVWRRGAFNWSVGGLICLLVYWAFASAGISHHQGPSIAVVVGIEVALAASLATGLFRNVAIGFIATIITFAVGTRGALLVFPWGMPVVVAYDAVQKVLGSNRNLGAPTLSRSAWLAARRAARPALAQGQILTNLVNECAAKYRGNDLSGSYPPNDTAKLFADCQSLGSTRAGTVISKFSDSDYGWRWSYTPGRPDSLGRITQYSVRVFEDPAIGQNAPQYTSDAGGAIQQLSSGRAPVTVATPIEALQLLHQCIARVPELRKADNEIARKYTHYRNPINEVLGRCPELLGHVSVFHGDQLSEYGSTAVTAPGRNANPADTVAVFGIELIPVDEKQFVFEVSAGTNTALPSYFMERDGVIHVRPGKDAN